MSLRIAMWSGPRNISTALMRAWENREDTTVIDEPFYAHYLKKTGAPHPGREAVMASQPTDWKEVAAKITGPVPGGQAVWYQKHMSQHFLEGMRGDWLDRLSHCFLIRDPAAVVASFTRQRPDAAAWELGFAQQAGLFDYVTDHTGAAPPVLDADDVLKNPEGMLRALCSLLGLDFSPRMLAWPAGPRDTDGVWAGHWYAAVERSTGFRPWRPRTPRLDAHRRRLADACRASYDRLEAHKIRV